MGYIRHHSIVVTSFDKEYISESYNEAVKQFGSLVSELIESQTNGYVTFFIAPDGSKEGWTPSNEADVKRAEYISFLKECDCVSYCEFFYGDDCGQAKIVNHN